MQGAFAPCRGLGCPQCFFLTSRRLRRRAKQEKEVLRGHPAPRQRAGRPLQSRFLSGSPKNLDLKENGVSLKWPSFVRILVLPQLASESMGQNRQEVEQAGQPESLQALSKSTTDVREESLYRWRTNIIDKENTRDTKEIQAEIRLYRRALEILDIPNDKDNEQYPIRKHLEDKIHNLELGTKDTHPQEHLANTEALLPQVSEKDARWNTNFIILMKHIHRIYQYIQDTEEFSISPRKEIMNANKKLLNDTLSTLNANITDFQQFHSNLYKDQWQTIEQTINQYIADTRHAKRGNKRIATFGKLQKTRVKFGALWQSATRKPLRLLDDDIADI